MTRPGRHSDSILPFAESDRRPSGTHAQHPDRDGHDQPSASPDELWAWAPFCLAAPLHRTARRLPKTTSTTYLTGLRGLACFFVFNHHVLDKQYPWIFRPYEGEHGHFLQWNMVRVFHTGKGMVCVFFALSGFVLSYAPLRLINTSRSDQVANDLLTMLCSAMLRRGVRLFTPLLAVVVMAVLYSWYDPSFDLGGWADGDPTFYEHVGKFWTNFVAVLNPYNWKLFYPDGFRVAWTLGYEFRLSFVVYVACVATSKLDTVWRRLLVATFALWSLYSDRRWDVVCFLGGFLLADSRFTPSFFAPKTNHERIMVTALAVLSVITGILLCSFPEVHPNRVRPYVALWQYTPQSWRGHAPTESGSSWLWFWGSFGSLFLLWGLENLPSAQACLSHKVFLYMGEISYAFYLLHLPIYKTVGRWTMAYFKGVLEWSPNASFVIMYLTTLAVAVVAADYFWRYVDEKSVLLSKRVVRDWLGVGAAARAGHVELREMPTPGPSHQLEQRSDGRCRSPEPKRE